MNPRCPPALVAAEATAAEAKQSKMVEKAKDPKRSSSAEDSVGTS